MNLPLPSTIKSKIDWNANNKFLRPRSFCLEHAVEIVELLQSKGGANVLVICHSGKDSPITYSLVGCVISSSTRFG